MKSLGKYVSKIVLMVMMFCFVFSLTAFANTKESNVIDILNVGHGKMSVATRDMYFVKDTLNTEKLQGVVTEGLDFTLGLYLNEKGKAYYKEQYKLENDPTLVVLFVRTRFDQTNQKLYRQVYKEKVFRSMNKDDWFEVKGENDYADVSDNNLWLTITNKVCSIALELKKQGKWID